MWAYLCLAFLASLFGIAIVPLIWYFEFKIQKKNKIWFYLFVIFPMGMIGIIAPSYIVQMLLEQKEPIIGGIAIATILFFIAGVLSHRLTIRIIRRNAEHRRKMTQPYIGLQ